MSFIGNSGRLNPEIFKDIENFIFHDADWWLLLKYKNSLNQFLNANMTLLVSQKNTNFS
jgi:hypothetical protein